MSKVKPEVTQRHLLSMQICVPKEWTDEQALAFAEYENPCGTSGGWGIRREGDYRHQGYPERNPCEERTGYVHIMFDA